MEHVAECVLDVLKRGYLVIRLKRGRSRRTLVRLPVRDAADGTPLREILREEPRVIVKLNPRRPSTGPEMDVGGMFRGLG